MSCTEKHSIELDPQNASAFASRGEINRLTGKFGKALKDLNQAIKLNPLSQSALIYRGRTFRQIKRYREAINDFTHCMEINPEEAHRAQTEIGKTYEAAGKSTEALETFFSALSIESSCTHCWSHIAAIYQTIYPADTIATHLRMISLPEIDTASVIATRAVALKRANLYEEALLDFNNAIEKDPQFTWALIGRASVNYLLHNYDASLADCNKVLKLEPNNTGALSIRADVSRSTEHLQEAIEDLEHAIELKPKLKHQAQKKIGLALYALRKYNDAVRAFRKSLAADPECHQCWEELVKTYRKIYSREKIPQLLNQVSVPRKNTPDVIVCKATALEVNGFVNEALENLDRAITINNNHAESLAFRGRLHLSNNRFHQAIEDFNCAFISAPDKAAYISELRGDAYLSLGQLEEALVDFNRAIELDSKRASSYGMRGEAYQWMGQYEKALADFEYATILDKQASKKFDVLWGLVLSYLNRFPEAIETYERALLANPDSFSIPYNIAIVMARWKGVESAQAYIESARKVLFKASEDNKEYGAALYGLGGLLMITGNITEALDNLERSIRLETKAIRWARHDIAWQDLRSNEHFRSLLQLDEE